MGAENAGIKQGWEGRGGAGEKDESQVEKFFNISLPRHDRH